ncbi:MAG: hypothetical protein LEGION0403_FIIPPAGN_00064 [Legionella sp.]|uniref:StlD/DarB family beta-ketosynthase n=1 Tax=Legionella sp. TaxID=459 RepID=UPI003D0F3CDB
MNHVFINKSSHFLPNEPVKNEDMEEILGRIGGNASRIKNIILNKNKITTRYYSLTRQGTTAFSNADMAASAVRKLFSKDFPAHKLQALCCGTSSPDLIMPSHASMVHGLLKETNTLEIFSPSGVCASAMQGLAYCYNAIKAGSIENAISTGSELASPLFKALFFESEYSRIAELQNNPTIAFEKDFLRFMLSDGAGAFLLSNTLSKGLNYEIEWIDSYSYANEMPPCMTQGGYAKNENEWVFWKEIPPKEWDAKSVFAVKQDTHLVEYCVPLATKSLLKSQKKRNIDFTTVDFFLPHISSMYFYKKLLSDYIENNIDIKESKWYTPLSDVGNVGSASIYIALDMLSKVKEIEDGNRILLFIPESSRFNFYYVMLRAKVY